MRTYQSMVPPTTTFPVDPKALQLMHHGAIALAQVESNGFAIDMDQLNTNMEELDSRIAEIKDKLQSDSIWKAWKKRFGFKASLTAGHQLATILYEEMRVDGGRKTASGKWQSDIEAFAIIDHPFVKSWGGLQKLYKIRNTYLKGVASETVKHHNEWFLHTFFNLHIARTFRSSSDSPNFQNIPIRIPEMARLIRNVFIPRRYLRSGKKAKRRLVELDFGGVEVRVAYMYHKDPVMGAYLQDPNSDMHRDMACKIFKCSAKQVGEELPNGDKNPMRHCAKNQFVFPQFYGDFFGNNARDIWNSIGQLGMYTGGKPTYEWLASKGISELGEIDEETRKPTAGSFLAHMQKIEDFFWNKRFVVYSEWKRRWYDDYLRTGGFTTKTGFRIVGDMDKNDVINYPVQGSAFHCLLYALIIIQGWLRKKGLETLIVGQIHDSIILDVYEREFDYVIDKCFDVMTRVVPKHWDWITLPLEVEAEAAPVGGSWLLKKKLKR